MEFLCVIEAITSNNFFENRSLSYHSLIYSALSLLICCLCMLKLKEHFEQHQSRNNTNVLQNHTELKVNCNFKQIKVISLLAKLYKEMVVASLSSGACIHLDMSGSYCYRVEHVFFHICYNA